MKGGPYYCRHGIMVAINSPLSEHVAIVEKALHASFLTAIVVDLFMDAFLIGNYWCGRSGCDDYYGRVLIGLTLATTVTACPIRMPYLWPLWDDYGTEEEN